MCRCQKDGPLHSAARWSNDGARWSSQGRVSESPAVLILQSGVAGRWKGEGHDVKRRWPRSLPAGLTCSEEARPRSLLDRRLAWHCYEPCNVRIFSQMRAVGPAALRCTVAMLLCD